MRPNVLINALLSAFVEVDLSQGLVVVDKTSASGPTPWKTAVAIPLMSVQNADTYTDGFRTRAGRSFEACETPDGSTEASQSATRPLPRYTSPTYSLPATMSIPLYCKFGELRVKYDSIILPQSD